MVFNPLCTIYLISLYLVFYQGRVWVWGLSSYSYFNQGYVRIALFWNCRVRYHWINLIYGPKNWHKRWCGSRPLFRRSTGNDLSGPLVSQFFPLDLFYPTFFGFYKTLSKKILIKSRNFGKVWKSYAARMEQRYIFLNYSATGGGLE